MSGELFPSSYWSFDGIFANLLENPANVQFNHRISAYVLGIVGIITFIKSRKNPIYFLRTSHVILFILLFGQVFLGVITVMYGAPYQIAIIHQFMALMLWLAAITVSFETAFPRRQVLV